MGKVSGQVITNAGLKVLQAMNGDHTLLLKCHTVLEKYPSKLVEAGKNIIGPAALMPHMIRNSDKKI